MEQSVARRAHNPKVVGSNPTPATNGLVAQSVEQWTENPCVGGSIPSQATINRSSGVAVNMPACHAGDRGFDPRLDRHLF